jgi:hypothetical protein
MAVNTYRRTVLTGSGTGSMAAIDGAVLADNDLCIVMDTSGNCYIYRLSASSGASESIPSIILPLANAGTKRWVLADVFFAKLINANGLKFPSTQVASSDANTLDDYEEGECQLSLSASTSGTITMSSYDDALYTKIGRLVHISGYLKVTSVSSPVGRLLLTGLPYIVKNTDSAYGAGSVWANTLTMPAGIVGFQLTSIKNTYQAYIDGMAVSINGTSWNAARVDLASAVKANTEIEFSLTYHTN